MIDNDHFVVKQIKELFRAEVKAVSASIQGLKDKLNGLCAQVTEVREIHSKCSTTDKCNTLQEEIQQLNMKVLELSHADISLDEFSKLKAEVLELAAVTNRIIWIAYIGLGSVVAKVIYDIYTR